MNYVQIMKLMDVINDMYELIIYRWIISNFVSILLVKVLKFTKFENV
jgi:hypothetical protein